MSMSVCMSASMNILGVLKEPMGRPMSEAIRSANI